MNPSFTLNALQRLPRLLQQDVLPLNPLEIPRLPAKTNSVTYFFEDFGPDALIALWMSASQTHMTNHTAREPRKKCWRPKKRRKNVSILRPALRYFFAHFVCSVGLCSVDRLLGCEAKTFAKSQTGHQIMAMTVLTDVGLFQCSSEHIRHTVVHATHL
jgi:hypothetical protein